MPNSSGIRAGRAYVELGADDRISGALRRAQARIKAFGQGVQRAGLGLTAVGGSAVAGFVLATKSFADAGTQLDGLSKRTGVGVEALSELQHAARQAGIDMEDLAGSIEESNIRLGEAIQDGTGPAVAALQQLGLSAEELSKVPLAERLGAIGDALSQIGNSSRRQFLADELFGGDAFRILPLLLQGSKGIAQLTARARELGIVMSSEAAKDAAELTQATAEMTSVMKAAQNVIGAALAPSLTEVSRSASRVLATSIGWLSANRQIIQQVAGLSVGVLGAGVAMLGLAVAIQSTAIIGGAVVGVLGAILSPLGLVTAAVTAATVAFVKYTDQGRAGVDFLKAKIGELGAIFRDTLGAIGNALSAGDLSLASQALFAGMQVAWLSGTNELRQVWASLQTDIAGIFVKTSALIESIWARTIAAVRSLSASAFENVASGLLTIADALGLIDERQASILKGAAQGAGSGIRSGTESQLQRQLQEINDRQAAQLEALLRDATDDQRERLKGLEQARRELERATQEARQARGAAAPGSIGDINSIADRLASATLSAGRGPSVRGSFDVFTARGFKFPSESVAKRNANANEQSADYLRSLYFASRRGGLVFA